MEIGEGVIDYENILNQIYRRARDRTYEFNLMLVGVKGIGKSSLVRSLFRGKIEPKETDGEAALNEYSSVIEGIEARLRLRVVETSNFRSHQPGQYIDYIDDKMNTYFVNQRRLPRQDIEDTRVHCCLYLIPLYGKMRLEEDDIECMKVLHERVNLIPIIPKSEFYNASQKTKFKENILADLKKHGINYYNFSFDERVDEDRARVVRQEAERFPFAVVAADEPVMEGKHPRWLRKTDACTIDIFDKKYDFEALSKLLIRHCMLDLINNTHVKHYAKFKKALLQKAQNEGYEILEDIGLEPHEIFRIEYEHLQRSHPDKTSLERWLTESEAELQQLRNKLNDLKSRSRQAPPSKLPILPEKPEFLKTRGTGAHQSIRGWPS